MARFFLMLWRQADWNVVPQRAAPGLLGEAPTFQSPILEKTARGNELGTIDLVSAGIEFATLAGGFASQHGETLGVTIVQDFDYLGAFIGKSEVPFVDDKRAAERVQDPEERRNGRSPGSEDRLVAERAHRKEKPRLPASGVTPEAKKRQFVEIVLSPRE